jgi:thiol-disulfide isomerase/thioredoxin
MSNTKWIRWIGCVLAFCLTLAPLSGFGEETTEPQFLQAFTATDLDGNEVDQTLFEAYDLTMINIWGTFCQPCVKEMPDLGKLHAAYAEKGVQIVGIVSDAMNADGSISESQAELAREIVQSTGAAYTHLLPSEDLRDILLWQVYAVPTTLFVNSQGALIGYSYMGAADYETWAQRIDETLALL